MKSNRIYNIPKSLAQTMDDADLLAPEWCTDIVETDGGYLCLEQEPDWYVWEEGYAR